MINFLTSIFFNMSRRNAAVKRPVLPDPQFNSRLASMMISRLMKHGKKSTAQKNTIRCFFNYQ